MTFFPPFEGQIGNRYAKLDGDFDLNFPFRSLILCFSICLFCFVLF